MQKVLSKLPTFLIVAAIIVAIGLIPQKTRTKTDEKKDLEKKTDNAFLTGFSISPKSVDTNDFLNFFDKISNTSDLVLWAGTTAELEKDNSAANSLASIAKTYKFTPVVVVDSVDEKLILDFISKNKPAFLGIGNEINREGDVKINTFAKDFERIYPEIKRASPETKVFPVFQLEIMKGLRGGLFGGVNDETKSQWKILEQFPNADLIAFTTYPGLIYKSPIEIPDDYYALIKTYTEKQIGFTEVGWPSEIDATGWETSESEQAEFISLFKEGMDEFEPEFAIWTFMYDQPVQKPFDTMGLISREGNEKEGWEVWIED